MLWDAPLKTPLFHLQPPHPSMVYSVHLLVGMIHLHGIPPLHRLVDLIDRSLDLFQPSTLIRNLLQFEDLYRMQDTPSS